MAGRGSKPGERRGGRQKGTPNKKTTLVREAIVEAFNLMGGVDSLVKWGKKHPGEFYTQLWAKLLPQQVKMDGKINGTVEQEDKSAPFNWDYVPLDLRLQVLEAYERGMEAAKQPPATKTPAAPSEVRPAECGLMETDKGGQVVRVQ